MSQGSQSADRISIGRIVRDAITGLKARFVDVMTLGAILLLAPSVLLGFITDPDSQTLWSIVANLPELVFEGAAIKLMYGALTGAPPAPAGDALRLSLTRLSQMFSIFALSYAPILLAFAGLSLFGDSVALAATPLVLAGAVTLNLLLIFAQPLVMLEDMPAFAAMSLSVRLTKGRRGPLLVVVLMMAALTALDYAVIRGGPALIALVQPKDVAGRIVSFIAEPLVVLVIEPIGAALVTATYLELRRGGRQVAATPARQASE